MGVDCDLTNQVVQLPPRPTVGADIEYGVRVPQQIKLHFLMPLTADSVYTDCS